MTSSSTVTISTGLQQATNACEAYGPGSRFLKGEVEQNVANSENAGRDILPPQAAIKYEAFVLFPDCVAPRLPFVRRLDFQARRPAGKSDARVGSRPM